MFIAIVAKSWLAAVANRRPIDYVSRGLRKVFEVRPIKRRVVDYWFYLADRVNKVVIEVEAFAVA